MIYFILVLLVISSLFSTEFSAPLLSAAHSGAPEEVNCSGCHSGVVNTGQGNVDYQIGTGNGYYTPNEILTILLSIEEGDLNQDSIINILDVVLLVGIILDNIELESHYLNLGDLNNDGQLNVVDIVLLVNMILGNS